MARIGLALSGGGSKGAFTIGVLKVANLLLDPVPYPVISGTSTGSLIGSLLATNQFARLVEIYSRVQTENIVNPHHALVAAIAGPEAVLFASAVLGGRAIYSTKALQDTIKKNTDFQRIKRNARKTLLIYNTVNLQTGELETFDNRRHAAGTLAKALLASASMPVLMDPVEFRRSGEVHQLVDGGVREFLPLGALFDSGVEVDHILAISTAPLRPKPKKGRIDAITSILTRTIELLDSEVGHDDYSGAQLFNAILRMIDNAEQAGLSRTKLLKNVPADIRRRLQGKRAVPITFIGPPRHIDMDSLEFDATKMRAVMKQGVAAGKKAIRKIAATL